MYDVQEVKTKIEVSIYKGIQDIPRKQGTSNIWDYHQEETRQGKIKENTWTLSLKDHIENLRQLARETLANIKSVTSKSYISYYH